MKRIITTTLLAVLLFAAQPLAQTQNEDLKKALQAAVEQLQNALKLLEPVEVAKQVATPQEFQEALNKGGVINIAPNAKLSAAGFTAWMSDTTIVGNGAHLHGETGPALRIPPGINKVRVTYLSGTSNFGSVFECGKNDLTQVAHAQQPKEIVFDHVSVPTHRGKRGIEINCGATVIEPKLLDIYSSEGQDSQAIALINSCGPLTVLRGELVAGSENFIAGGDTLKIKDCPEGVATDLLFDGVLFHKPVEWRLNNVRVAPKNVFELKAGKRVTVKNSIIRHSYKAASGGGATQDASCIVITPKNNQFIDTVVFENNIIEQCGGGVQLMGKDYNSTTPHTTKGVVFRNNKWNIDGPTYGGRGILALVVGGMADATWEGDEIIHTAAQLFAGDSQTPMGPFTLKGVKSTTGKIVCAMPGVNYCGPAPAAYAGRSFTLIAEGNTFADAPTQFKTLYPKNTWVTRAELTTLLQAK